MHYGNVLVMVVVVPCTQHLEVALAFQGCLQPSFGQNKLAVFKNMLVYLMAACCTPRQVVIIHWFCWDRLERVILLITAGPASLLKAMDH